jgi:hypothetical protein
MGLRLVADVLQEISFHLVEPVVYTQIVSVLTSSGFGEGGFGEGGFGGGAGSLIEVGSTNAMYPGALIVVGWQASDAEVATVTEVVDSTHFVATLTNLHASGETVLGPTFPLQQPTDPVFTQAEMLGYLARAQNEFLSQCPIVYAQASASTIFGQYLQSAPDNMIEMERVSLSQMALTSVSLSRDGTGTVTANFPYQHGLTQSQTFTVYQSVDTSFLGAFAVATIVSDTVVTWLQDGTSATSSSASLGLFNRLYEQTQEENTMFDRTWRNDFTPVPTGFFEDRSGNYGWGLNSVPGGNFPMNLTYSTRGPDTLGLLDSFVIPDTLLYLCKYKAMEFAFSKDGVMASPQRSAYCKQRFDRGVLIVRRFFEGNEMGLSKGNGLD